MPTPRRHETNAARQRAYRARQTAARMAGMRLPPGSPLGNVPSAARCKAMRGQAELLLQTLEDEMQVYWDDRSEAWQESSKGQEHEQRMEEISEALAALRAIT